MKRITVIIDRPEGSNPSASVDAIQKVVEALKPLNVRIRITRATATLREDKAWRN